MDNEAQSVAKRVIEDNEDTTYGIIEVHYAGPFVVIRSSDSGYFLDKIWQPSAELLAHRIRELNELELEDL